MPNFRRHLSSAFYFNKSLGKTFICKVVRLNVKQRRSRWDGLLSRLIWIYAVCKSLLSSPVAVKELSSNPVETGTFISKIKFTLYLDNALCLIDSYGQENIQQEVAISVDATQQQNTDVSRRFAELLVYNITYTCAYQPRLANQSRKDNRLSVLPLRSIID